MSRYENRGDDSYRSDEPESIAALRDGLDNAGPRQVRTPLNDAARAAVIRQINGSLTALLIYMAELRNHSDAFGPVKDDQAYLKQVVENAFQQIGRDLGLSEPAVKTAAHRLRRRYRELLRAEVAQTVTSPEEVEDELRDLFAAVRREKS